MSSHENATVKARLAGYGPRLALLGAVLTTLGDFGQLWVVNAARPELQLPVPPGTLIVWATLAGALGIPLQGVLRSGSIMLTLWFLAGLAFVVATGTELRLAQHRRWWAFNPLVLTIIIGAAAPLFGLPWRDFLGPGSINVAHVIFFAHMARVRPS